MRPVLSTILCLAPLSLSPMTHAAEPKQYTIEQFLSSENVSGASFSPDGSKLLVTSDRTGILNVYALPVDGSPAIQLTHSTTESMLSRTYFPNDERFIFEADQGGNELNHVYVRELNGTDLDVTPGERLKASFMGWADDEQSFFVTTNERDPRYFDLYEVSLDGYAKALLYKNETGMDVQAVSPDKRFLALGKPNTRKDTDVFLLDRDTGETRELMNPKSDAVCSAAEFSKDGKTLYALTDEGREFQYVVTIDLATGKQSTLLRLDWDIMYVSRTRSGRHWVIGVNNDARSDVYVYEASEDGTLRQEHLAKTVIDSNGISRVAISSAEDAYAFYTEGGRTPGDIFYSKRGVQGMTRLTARLHPDIDPEDLVEPEVVRFVSYDGVAVPGILYKPKQATAENKRPALVWVHGGPGGQTRADWNALIQYLVNHGYAVYGINNRGSSGYGKTFFAMDDQKHGSADLDDCIANKQMLIDTGWVDPERIGIIGGSYGGYMVCAALAFRPGAFEVGVNIFGVTNWVRTLKSIPPWWEAGRNALYLELGDPNTQEEYLASISPLFHAKNIVDPMIVLQGANDPRVLQVESDEMVEAVRANDVPVEYVVFPDEGHGFRKKVNQIQGYEAVMEFLNAHMAKD